MNLLVLKNIIKNNYGGGLNKTQVLNLTLILYSMFKLKDYMNTKDNL